MWKVAEVMPLPMTKGGELGSAKVPRVCKVPPMKLNSSGLPPLEFREPALIRTETSVIVEKYPSVRLLVTKRLPPATSNEFVFELAPLPIVRLYARTEPALLTIKVWPPLPLPKLLPRARVLRVLQTEPG